MMFGEMVVSRAGEMGIELPMGAAQKFQQYYDMLAEANKTTNLARGLEDPSDAADRHFMDSLTPLLAVKIPLGARLIDVGSGAGFPGLPLAIARPDLEITLLDALGKRTAFQQSVIDALCLNARAVHQRCEDAGRSKDFRERYDFAVARAVAALPVLAEWLSPFVKVGGKMILLKGPAVEDELAAAGRALRETGLSLADQKRISPPGRDWDHRIVILSKTAPLSARYPRKAGTASKMPL